VHTSTVTVAVLEAEADLTFDLTRADVAIKTARGSGPGGQHRNKTDSCVTATHVPTGVRVRIDTRSQHQNRAMALAILADRLEQAHVERERMRRDSARREQLGSGMRGDKIRTYRQADDLVTDHRTGRTWRLRR
jgi:peptide chain release factor 1